MIIKNLLVYTLFFVIKNKILNVLIYICITLKCADCICAIEECKVSQSPFDCPNCILNKCCCWDNFHFTANKDNYNQ